MTLLERGHDSFHGALPSAFQFGTLAIAHDNRCLHTLIGAVQVVGVQRPALGTWR